MRRLKKEPLWRSMHFVNHDDVTVRVREYTFMSDSGLRHAAELSLDGELLEKAVIEGHSAEELKRILDTAVKLFAVTRRLRRRAAAS
jgi:hypothetical protein